MNPAVSLTRGAATHVHQGGFAVSDSRDTIFAAVLGSCVAVCLHEADRRIGGMNHILLPGVGDREDVTRRYGVQLMELLINDLMRRGARRDRLVAKLFGGARVLPRFADIGAANIAFARRFLAAEEIPLLSESTGGGHARRLRFRPVTGEAKVMLLRAAEAPELSRAAPTAPAPVGGGGDVELF